MERQDGKDPFDAKTYNSPATISTMIELRAFCAAFFELNIRANTAIEETLFAKFITLITTSTKFFARAQAVVPELQGQQNETTYVNPNVQRVLQATLELHSSNPKDWENLIEESAWTRLAQDGQEQFAKELERVAKTPQEHKRHTGVAKSPPHSIVATSPVLPDTPSSAEPVKGKDSKTNLRKASVVSYYSGPSTPASPGPSISRSLHPLPSKPPQPQTTAMNPKAKLADIPIFVPRHQMAGVRQLVWSPTSGTRQRRPDEMYKSLDTHPALLTTFGREISGNVPRNDPRFVQPHPIVTSIKDEVPDMKHSGRAATDDRSTSIVEFTPYENLPSPLGPGSSSTARPREEASSRNRVPSRVRIVRDSPLAGTYGAFAGSVSGTSRKFETPGYAREPTNIQTPSNMTDPRYPVNRTRGIIGSESFSAPPSIAGSGNLPISGQGLYGGSESPPFQIQGGQLQYAGPQNPSFHQQTGQGQYGGPGSPSFNPQPGQVQHGMPSNPSFHPQPGQVPYSETRNLPFHTQRGSPSNAQYSQRGNAFHSRPCQGLGSYQSQNPQNFLPSPDIWGPHPPAPTNYTHQNHPISQPAAPTYQMQQQSPQFSSQENVNLQIPSPTSLPPLAYWNLLHHLTNTLLSTSPHPLTPPQQNYLTALSEARIQAASSQLPVRGKRNAKTWLAVLNKTMDEVWVQQPGQLPLVGIVVERKSDFEAAVAREITSVERDIELMKVQGKKQSCTATQKLPAALGW